MAHHRALGRTLRAQPHRHLGDHSEGPLRADQQRAQVVSGHALGGAPPQPDHLAAAGDHLQPQHVVAGDAVLDAAHPAGVGGDVAAYGRPGGAGRVRRVPQPVLGAGPAQIVVDDAGLHHGQPLAGVDLQHLVHGLEGHHDGAVQGVGPARQPGARAARHQRHPVLQAPAHQGAHLGGGPGPGHGERTAVRGPLGLVVPVAVHGLRRRQDPALGQRFGQCPGEVADRAGLAADGVSVLVHAPSSANACRAVQLSSSSAATARGTGGHP